MIVHADMISKDKVEGGRNIAYTELAKLCILTNGCFFLSSLYTPPHIPHPHTSHPTPSHPSHLTPPHTSHPLTPHTSSHLTPHTPHPSQSASEGDTTIAMDHGLHHHQRLQDANRGLDHILNHGRDIVDNLKNQGFTLKAS